MESPDFLSCYQRLGVRPDAEWDAVREAYRRAAQRLHPDRHHSGGEEVSDEFKAVNQAFHILERYYRHHGELPRPVAPAHASRARPARRRSAPSRDAGAAPPDGMKPHAAGRRSRFGRRTAGLLLVLAAAGWILGDQGDGNDQAIQVEAPEGSDGDGLHGMAEGMANAVPAYFQRGSLKGEVVAVQGRPERIEHTPHGEVWHYGRSRVVFEDDVVRTWEIDLSSPLRIRLDNEREHVQPRFTYGASKSEVRVIQGVPERATEDVWEYGMSRVYFENGEVIGWENNPVSPLHVHE